VSKYEFVHAPQRSEEWHKLRATGVGASEVAAIAGVSPYKTAYQLWAEKRGEYKPRPIGPAGQRGVLLEDSVAKWYEEETGRKVSESPGIVRLIEHPWAMASLDRTIDDSDGLLEIKTSASPRWTLYPVPPEVEAQVQWQMMITGAPWCDVAALLGGLTFRVERVTANAKYQDELFRRAQIFWDMVQSGNPPPTAGSDSDAFAQVNPQASEEWVLADGAAERLAAAYEEAANEERMASEQLQDLAMQMKEIIGKKQGVIGKGWQASWKQNRPSRKVDYKMLLEAVKPPVEIVDAYTQETPGARVFRFRRNNEGE
jgi:putative phage-type endonuclease